MLSNAPHFLKALEHQSEKPGPIIMSINFGYCLKGFADSGCWEGGNDIGS